MKLTVKIKLLPDKEQSDFLKQTVLVCNKACNHISEKAWTNKIFGQYNLQKLLYKTIKETLSSVLLKLLTLINLTRKLKENLNFLVQ